MKSLCTIDKIRRPEKASQFGSNIGLESRVGADGMMKALSVQQEPLFTDQGYIVEVVTDLRRNRN